MKLTGMTFDVKFDRPVIPGRHCICPGGYILNGKQFDFCHFEGTKTEDDTLRCEVSDFDWEYAEDNGVDEVIPEDITGKFSEFFIYTGEYNDPQIYPTEIKNLSFDFDETRFICPPETLKSANEALFAA